MCFDFLNKSLQESKNNNEVFVVLIINGTDVKWEIFDRYNTLLDVYKFIKKTYNIKLHISSINEVKMKISKYDTLDKFVCNETNALSMKLYTD